jgi:hypothetical protein
MPESQRVKSGSVTKGSTATLSGSAEYFYQGVNSDSFTSYATSLLPRMGSADRLELHRNGKLLSRETFDDSITINNTLSDMGGSAAEPPVKEVISFSLERLAFGQPPETPQGEPYADMTSFDPVAYLQDQNEFMWPVNLWNIGSLPDHEYDGVIEPLDIRRQILGDVDSKYEGHAIKGSVVGSSSERPWGSVEITDSWFINQSTLPSFLDSPLTLPTVEESSTIIALQAYQDISTPPELPHIETDYHSKVYSSIMAHNSEDMMLALRLLNSSSCDSISDPFLKTATRGVSLNSDVGSIAFNNNLVVGEY